MTPTATDDADLSESQMLEVYQTRGQARKVPLCPRRWIVEEYHKSLKQHASLCHSPTYHPRAQVKHVLCSLYAYLKLVKLRLNHRLNPFALRSKLYLAALNASWKQLRVLHVPTQSTTLSIA